MLLSALLAMGRIPQLFLPFEKISTYKEKASTSTKVTRALIISRHAVNEKQKFKVNFSHDLS